MQRLRVYVYQTGNTEPETIITIPITVLRVAMKLLPQKVQDALADEGIDLSCLSEITGEQGTKGTLIEVEKVNQKLVIAVE